MAISQGSVAYGREHYLRDHLRAVIALCVVIAVFIAGLTVACLYNPTPSNTSGGGPGSSYPIQHHKDNYLHPIGGNGPQSS